MKLGVAVEAAAYLVDQGVAGIEEGQFRKALLDAQHLRGVAVGIGEKQAAHLVVAVRRDDARHDDEGFAGGAEGVFEEGVVGRRQQHEGRLQSGQGGVEWDVAGR